MLSDPLPRVAAMSLTIDCDDCVMQHTAACEDCLVTFLCDHHERDAVIIDFEDVRALRVLSEGGLVPELRHVSRGRSP